MSCVRLSFQDQVQGGGEGVRGVRAAGRRGAAFYITPILHYILLLSRRADVGSGGSTGEVRRAKERVYLVYTS